MVDWMAQAVHCCIPCGVYVFDQFPVQFSLSLTGHHLFPNFLKSGLVVWIDVGPGGENEAVSQVFETELSLKATSNKGLS